MAMSSCACIEIGRIFSLYDRTSCQECLERLAEDYYCSSQSEAMERGRNRGRGGRHPRQHHAGVKRENRGWGHNRDEKRQRGNTSAYTQNIKMELVKIESKPEVEKSPAKPLPEVDFIAKDSSNPETPYEGCVCISNFPIGEKKEILANFIRHQFIVKQRKECEIIACSVLRHYAFVEFKEQSDVYNAKNALDKVPFYGSSDQPETLRLFGNEDEMWKEFLAEAFRKKAQEEEARKQAKLKKDDDKLEAVDDVTSPRLEYFRKLNEANCIFIRNLPDRFGPTELKNFIEKVCENRQEERRKRGIPITIDPTISKCHVRFNQKDACVELDTHMTTDIVQLLNERPIQEGNLIVVKKWTPKKTKEFIEYYREKEERKKQKPNEQQYQQNEQAFSTPSESFPAETNIKKSADDSAMQKEMIRMKKELEALMSERDRYKADFIKVTKQHTLLKLGHDQLSVAKKELEQKLIRVEEEADTKQFNLKAELKEVEESKAKLEKSNIEQKQLVEDLQKENGELKDRLHSMEQAQQEAEISYSNLHAQFTAMEKENSDLKRSLHQSRQELNTAHSERDDARESLQSVRVQAHNEKDARLKEVQEKLVNVKREWVEKAKENGKLRKKTLVVEKALDVLREPLSNTGEKSNTLVKIESAVKKETGQLEKDKGNPNAG